ncbi:hypothetical protein [Mageeibacillus indolicus]|uniref:hypothetical protein n=1 Tax=Mageeibacillus indolicus TaxID=884684 RepID=UPI003BFA6BA8
MDKHDCVILDANGKCFIEVFTFKNSRDGFEQLMSELQSLTRYRATLVADCSSKKVSLVRLCQILFPELKSLVPSLHRYKKPSKRIGTPTNYSSYSSLSTAN